MINVGELITDPDFCQTFTLIRRVGEWNEGVWNPSEARITITGITHPASGRELEMLPEADRTKNLRTFYGRSGTTPRIETQNRMADEIAYNGSVFKIIQEQDFDDYGYWQAVGIEEEGKQGNRKENYELFEGKSWLLLYYKWRNIYGLGAISYKDKLIMLSLRASESFKAVGRKRHVWIFYCLS